MPRHRLMLSPASNAKFESVMPISNLQESIDVAVMPGRNAPVEHGRPSALFEGDQNATWVSVR